MPHTRLAIKRREKKKQTADATGMTNKNHAGSGQWSHGGRYVIRYAATAGAARSKNLYWWLKSRLRRNRNNTSRTVAAHSLSRCRCLRTRSRLRRLSLWANGFGKSQTSERWLRVERPALALLTASASGGRRLSWTSGSERCATCHRTGARSGSPPTAGWLERHSWKSDEHKGIRRFFKC